LHRIQELEEVSGVHQLSISIFDHWLSREEAEQLLVNVPAQEQLRRDKLHFELSSLLTTQTELIHFVFRGRKRDKPRFKLFDSGNGALDYLRPQSLGGKRKQQFQVLLPECGAVFYEGYDDTSHLYFTDPELIRSFCNAVHHVGLHVLSHS
jgi:hypothetical protein